MHDIAAQLPTGKRAQDIDRQSFLLLPPYGCDEEIFVVNQRLIFGIFGCISPAPQGFEIGGESNLAGFIESTECNLRWAKILAEEIYGSHRVYWEMEVDGHEFRVHISKLWLETLTHSLLITPKHRWNDAGRRRHVAATDLEHLSRKALWIPVGHG